MRSLPADPHRLMRLGLPAVALLGVAFAGEARAADSHRIDPGHSAIIFKVKHLNIGYTYGRFRTFAGSFTLDRAAPKRSSVKVEIDANSVYTADKKRDKHLQSPDFLNVKRYPKISFVSAKVRRSGNKWHVTGKLTLHGTTKIVKIGMAMVGAGKDPYGGHRVGFEGQLRIKRTQFGMTKMVGPAGDEIVIILAFEGIKQ